MEAADFVVDLLRWSEAHGVAAPARVAAPRQEVDWGAVEAAAGDFAQQAEPAMRSANSVSAGRGEGCRLAPVGLRVSSVFRLAIPGSECARSSRWLDGDEPRHHAEMPPVHCRHRAVQFQGGCRDEGIGHPQAAGPPVRA